MPAAAASSAPRLPSPLLRMKAPAEIRAGSSERVMGSPMRNLAEERAVLEGSTASGSALLSPAPAPSIVPRGTQRPRRLRALKDAADDVPARAASSARVRAGPVARPLMAEVFLAEVFLAEVFLAEVLVADPPPPRRRR